MTEDRRTVVVLDVANHGGRRLAETVAASGFPVREESDLEAFIASLRLDRLLVGVVAFEALWPEPQKMLRALREWVPGARIVVVMSQGAPRARLGQRLWSVGLLDYLVPRETPPHALAPLLRQAWADGIIAAAATPGDPMVPDLNPQSTRVRLLQNLGAAFTSQRTVEGLLRELQMKLPHLCDYDVLEVLVVQEGAPRLFVLPTRAVPHEVLWRLAEQTCAAVAPFAETPFGAQDVIVLERPTIGGAAEDDPEDADDMPTGQGSVLTVPMVLGGDLVGCVSLLLSGGDGVTADTRAMLQLISYQLGASLRNAQALEVAERATLVDDLTGAYNRRFLRRALESEWKRAQRYHLELAVALIDVDHFRLVNDLHGHVVGDAVLRGVVSVVREHLRETDSVVRYGNEEFLLLLAETSVPEAALVVERIRLLLARQPVWTSGDGVNLQVTVSAGIAGVPRSGAATPDDLVTLADQALLAAKTSGRDRVCIATGSGVEDLSTAPTVEPGQDKRRFPRLSSQLKVRYVELPEFEGRAVTLESTDISAGGIALRGPETHLRRSAYALVQLEDGGAPILSRVIWTREEGEGKRSAGLRFLKSDDIEALEPAKGPWPKALVISERTQTRDLVARVLRAARYDAQLVYDTLEGLEQTPLEDFSLVVIGESSLRRDLGGRLRQLRERAGPSLRIVVMNEVSDRRAALDAIRSERIEHLIPSDPASEEALFATLNKLMLGEYFGMKKYLLWGADPKAWAVATSEDKDQVLQGIRQIAREVRCHPRVVDLLVAAVDEMIINALFRPTDAGASEQKPVTVECGSDGRLLAVAVRDDHGLFRHEDLFRGLGEALQHEDHGIPDSATQASLGFRIMLGTLSQLAINVDPGRCTELIGIVDLRRSLREHRLSAPSLGFFRRGPEGQGE